MADLGRNLKGTPMGKKIALNLIILAAVVAATQANSFTYLSDDDAKPLLEKGFVEQNPSPDALNAANERQTRATAAGIEYSQKNPAPAASSASATAAKEKPVFGMAVVEIPDIKRGGGEKPSVYPFDELGVKGDGKPNSFFVPATLERPEPAKALASTVSGATRRHAQQSTSQPMKTVKTKNGDKEVPNMIPTRKFVIRAVEDGAPWGEQFKGVAGAAIYRQS